MLVSPYSSLGWWYSEKKVQCDTSDASFADQKAILDVLWVEGGLRLGYQETGVLATWLRGLGSSGLH